MSGPEEMLQNDFFTLIFIKGGGFFACPVKLACFVMIYWSHEWISYYSLLVSERVENQLELQRECALVVSRLYSSLMKSACGGGSGFFFLGLPQSISPYSAPLCLIMNPVSVQNVHSHLALNQQITAQFSLKESEMTESLQLLLILLLLKSPYH